MKKALFVVTLSLLAVGVVPTRAGDFKDQVDLGGAFFTASPPCPAKQFPTFETIAPVPGIVDAFDQDFVPVFCQIETKNGSSPVKGVRGHYTAQLIVLDNVTGAFDAFDVDSGPFKTNRRGIAGFDFDLPTEIFADGFESGDVSAWSYTRSDFTNKRQVTNTSVQCGTGASKSE